MREFQEDDDLKPDNLFQERLKGMTHGRYEYPIGNLGEKQFARDLQLQRHYLSEFQAANPKADLQSAFADTFKLQANWTIMRRMNNSFRDAEDRFEEMPQPVYQTARAAVQQEAQTYEQPRVKGELRSLAQLLKGALLKEFPTADCTIDIYDLPFRLREHLMDIEATRKALICCRQKNAHNDVSLQMQTLAKDQRAVLDNEDLRHQVRNSVPIVRGFLAEIEGRKKRLKFFYGILKMRMHHGELREMQDRIRYAEIEQKNTETQMQKLVKREETKNTNKETLKRANMEYGLPSKANFDQPYQPWADGADMWNPYAGPDQVNNQADNYPGMQQVGAGFVPPEPQWHQAAHVGARPPQQRAPMHFIGQPVMMQSGRGPTNTAPMHFGEQPHMMQPGQGPTSKPPMQFVGQPRMMEPGQGPPNRPPMHIGGQPFAMPSGQAVMAGQPVPGWQNVQAPYGAQPDMFNQGPGYGWGGPMLNDPNMTGQTLQNFAGSDQAQNQRSVKQQSDQNAQAYGGWGNGNQQSPVNNAWGAPGDHKELKQKSTDTGNTHDHFNNHSERNNAWKAASNQSFKSQSNRSNPDNGWGTGGDDYAAPANDQQPWGRASQGSKGGDAAWPANSHHGSDPRGKSTVREDVSADPKAFIKSYWKDWNKVVNGEEAMGKKSHRKYLEPGNVHNYAAPPLPAIPYNKAKDASHGIQAGKGTDYDHKTRRPIYIDTMENPYASFTFKYGSKGKLEQESKIKIDDVDTKKIKEQAEKDKYESMPKHQLVKELMQKREATPNNDTRAASGSKEAVEQWADNVSNSRGAGAQWGGQGSRDGGSKVGWGGNGSKGGGSNEGWDRKGSKAGDKNGGWDGNGSDAGDNNSSWNAHESTREESHSGWEQTGRSILGEALKSGAKDRKSVRAHGGSQMDDGQKGGIHGAWTSDELEDAPNRDDWNYGALNHGGFNQDGMYYGGPDYGGLQYGDFNYGGLNYGPPHYGGLRYGGFNPGGIGPGGFIPHGVNDVEYNPHGFNQALRNERGWNNRGEDEAKNSESGEVNGSSEFDRELGVSKKIEAKHFGKAYPKEMPKTPQVIPQVARPPTAHDDGNGFGFGFNNGLGGYAGNKPFRTWRGYDNAQPVEETYDHSKPDHAKTGGIHTPKRFVQESFCYPTPEYLKHPAHLSTCKTEME